MTNFENGRPLDIDDLAQGLEEVARAGLVTHRIVERAQSRPSLARLLAFGLLGAPGTPDLERADRLAEVLETVLPHLGEGRLAAAADALLAISPEYRGQSWSQRRYNAAYIWNPDYRNVRYFDRPRREIIREVAAKLARHQAGQPEASASSETSEVDYADGQSVSSGPVRTHQSLRSLFEGSPGAASWLTVFAHFASDPIPLTPMEEKIGGFDLPPVLVPLDDKPLRWYINRLTLGGLLDRLPGDRFSVLKSIASETLRFVNDETRNAALYSAFILLDEVFPVDGEDERYWHISEPLVPHVLTVTSAAESISPGRRAAHILYARVSAYHRSRGTPEEFDKAVKVGRRALTCAVRAYGEDSPRIAITLGTLAHALKDSGEFAEADRLFARVIELEKRDPSVQPPELAVSINLRASTLNRMARYKEADDLWHKALALFPEDNRGQKYAQVANDFAVSLEHRDRPEEALPLYESARREIGNGSRANNVQMNIGRVLKVLGRLDEARVALEKADADQLAINVPDHGLLRETLRHLKGVCEALGDETCVKETQQRIDQLKMPWV